ncbi:hypothetical protein EDD25_1217 [Cryobacterium psychrophilum]|nr:hypothetical protein [Cryobacterium psychrophilum]TDW29517.1 hypothetical protein EDD25_1217 [Cryobacterium psychrophilum]
MFEPSSITSSRGSVGAGGLGNLLDRHPVLLADNGVVFRDERADQLDRRAGVMRLDQDQDEHDIEWLAHRRDVAQMRDLRRCHRRR